MAIPTSQATLLAAIDTSFAKLMADLERVPVDQARVASMDGHAAGTRMSPADLVAYLLGWNTLVLSWLERDDRGEPVPFPESGFTWAELGQLAQKFYADYQSADWPELLTRLRTVQARLAETIAARSNDELYGRVWYRTWTKGRMIQLNTSSPYTNARGRIRAWLKHRA
jgi:hypothetical protein